VYVSSSINPCEGIYFETGSDVITAESDAALEVIGGYLGANPDGRDYVVGHTDDTGEPATNLALSAAHTSHAARARAHRLISTTNAAAA